MPRPSDQTAPLHIPPVMAPPRSPQGVIVGAVIVLIVGIIAFLLITRLGGDGSDTRQARLIPPTTSTDVTVVVPASPSPSATASPAGAAASSASARDRRTSEPEPTRDAEETNKDPSDNDDTQITVIQGESGDEGEQQPDDGARRSGDNQSGEHVSSCPNNERPPC